jgi:hypothetical protein
MGRETRPVFAAATTKNYFAALGIPLALGPRLSATDDLDDVVVLGDSILAAALQRRPGDCRLASSGSRGDRSRSSASCRRSIERLVGFGLAPEKSTSRATWTTRCSSIYARLKPGSTLGEVRERVKSAAARINEVAPAAVDYAERVTCRRRQGSIACRKRRI